MLILTKTYLIYILCIILRASLCRLTVLNPSGLANHFVEEPDGNLYALFNRMIMKLGIPYSIANYGVINYGKTIMGTVYYASPANACNALTYEPYNNTNKKSIFVVERGDCTFVTKSLHAQQKGAQLLIIINDEPGDVDQLNLVAPDVLGIIIIGQ